jgi:hypothetical protein
MVKAALEREGVPTVPKAHRHYDDDGRQQDVSDWSGKHDDQHVHAARPHAFLLRNYQTFSRLQGTNMFKVWQGMRATSAAPSYWAPCVDDQGRVFVDGGVGNNNPTLLAYLEAKSLFVNDGINAAPASALTTATHIGNPIGLVLSLGTGLADQKTLSQHWWSRAGSWVTSSLTTGEMVHDLCAALFTGPFMPAYLRFQPRQNAGALELDEHNPLKLQALLEITQKYLETEPYKTRFNILCDMLADDDHSKAGSVMTAQRLEQLETQAAKEMTDSGAPGISDKATRSLMHVMV